MRNIKKIRTRLAIFTLIGTFTILSAGCEIVPYHYHEDEGYHGYHHHHHRDRDEDHDFRGRWK